MEKHGGAESEEMFPKGGGKRRINEKRSAWVILRRVTGMLLILAGLCVYLYPAVCNLFFEYRSSTAIRAFLEQFGTGEDTTDAAMGSQNTENPEEEEATVYPSKYTESEAASEDSDLLYRACFAYNCRIYAASQAGLKDVESYETFDLDDEAMSLLSDGMFGYLEIPAMDVILPLYLGSSTEHMAAGAAVLGETSAPIGGLNTNAVISGHRGYRGSPYFREIEKLTVGDVVYLTNPWGTLVYTVSEIDIISPLDADAVKIQEGRDMITLLTCHPYRSGGKYRYVVYCDRAETDGTGEDIFSEESENGDMAENGENSAIEEQQNTKIPEDMSVAFQNSTDTGTEYIVASDGTVYVSSEKDIRTEQMLRLGSGIFLAVLFMTLCLFSWKHKRK